MFVSVIIGLMPFNAVRIALYRMLLGYNVDAKSKIGMFNIILCSTVKMTNAQIGSFNFINVNELCLYSGSIIKKLNRFKSLHRVSLGIGSIVWSKNFFGGPRKELEFQGKAFDEQNLIVGENSSLLRNNYFDIVKQIKIGDNVVFGGNGSEIWTHGFDTKKTLISGAVEFGNNIFVGSNCIFTKSIIICDEVSIGPASTVYKSIINSGVYSTHRLERVN